MPKESLHFNQGLYKLNDEPNFNFQLNRIIMWNNGNLKDIERIGSKIKNSLDWKTELIKIGDVALKKNRLKEAIAYYRMSEFFMYDGDPDKLKYYNLATSMFYEYYKEYFEDGTVIKYEIPYENIYLPVLFKKSDTVKKGIVLLHGGNDSYMEELFFAMLYLANEGFDVYLFEGPGQGGVMRVQNTHFTYKWEKPVKALLDFFNLNDVTIIGASLGGMLAPRAAAFEKRIKKVIAWSIFPDFFSVMISTATPMEQKIVKLLFKLHAASLINLMSNIAAKKDQTTDWGLKHGMYAYNAKSPYEYALKLKDYTLKDVGKLITQDILILGATEDHFINYKLFKEELDYLPNINSLTFRLFTKNEFASNHCNMGNPELALKTMTTWINNH